MALELAPAVGGSICALTVSGVHILRPAPIENHQDALDASSFPLVPIVNRIPEGRFEFDGRKIQLGLNLPGSPDFLHGQGWRSIWERTEASDKHAVLQLNHAEGEWPWSYVAEQRFELLSNGLRTELSVTNTSDHRMPAGLGFHPYFLRTSSTRIQTNYAGYWRADAALHPKEQVPGSYRKDWCMGADVIDTELTDHTHYGFSGQVTISEPGRPTITIEASPECNKLHIYTPLDGHSYCLEPVTDRADPFGALPWEINIIEPQQTFSIWMTLTAA